MHTNVNDIDWSLYLVTDPCAGADLVDIVLAAVSGGVSVVQLRDKYASDAEVLAQGRDLLAALPPHVPLFIDDRVAVAAELGCHVHVGPTDTPVAQARALLAPGSMVGLSVKNRTQLDAVAQLPVDSPARPDVIGIGPVYDTTTKVESPPGMGVDAAAALGAAAAAAGLPAVAIGGIKPDNAAPLASTHFRGICTVSAIMQSPDPAATARHFLKVLHHDV